VLDANAHADSAAVGVATTEAATDAGASMTGTAATATPPPRD
jgi:hypothetical protein